MSLLPAMGSIGTIGRAASRVFRNPAVQGAAGAAAGAAMVDQFGRRVATRRRRSKGITARELKSFTRVTGILNKYCKTAPPRRRAAPARGKACR